LSFLMRHGEDTKEAWGGKKRDKESLNRWSRPKEKEPALSSAQRRRHEGWGEGGEKRKSLLITDRRGERVV